MCIRDRYSTLGNFFIAENVIVSLLTYLCENMPGVSRVNKVKIKSDRLGVSMNIELTMLLQPNMKKTLADIQLMLKENIEHMTGFYLNPVSYTHLFLVF